MTTELEKKSKPKYTVYVDTEPPTYRRCTYYSFGVGFLIGFTTSMSVTFGYLVPTEETDCIPTVNGAWADWSSWGVCIQSCYNSEQFAARSRTCTNPPPSGDDGLNCVGNSQEFRKCSGAKACSTGSGWSEWSVWSKCDPDCIGKKSRRRECKESIPKHGGIICKRWIEETRACGPNCHNTWNEWEPWVCNAKCGHGTQTRTRTCGGTGCQGSPSEEEYCYSSTACTGTWQEWGAWSCDTTCGNGIQIRSRECSIPNQCAGPSTETESCYRTCS